MKEIKIRVVDTESKIIGEENIKTETANILVISYDENEITFNEVYEMAEKLIKGLKSNGDPITIITSPNSPVQLKALKLE
jgi:uncharacterized lipoprotein YbaY